MASTDFSSLSRPSSRSVGNPQPNDVSPGTAQRGLSSPLPRRLPDPWEFRPAVPEALRPAPQFPLWIGALQLRTCDYDDPALLPFYQSSALAIRAPSTSASNLAHITDGGTRWMN